MELIDKALKFSTAAHAAVNQKRKYTGEDYIFTLLPFLRLLRRLVGQKK
jgi:hypothetical protein